MKIYLVVFLAVLLLLVLLAYPFKISLKMHVNFISLKAFYSIKVMFIKLLCGTTYIEDNNLIIQNTHNLIYDLAKDRKKQMTQIESFVSKISVSKVQLYFSAGIQNNAYQTAMLCGYAYSISSALISYLITKNSTINIYQDIDPQYNKDALDLTVKCILEISLLDVLAALIASKTKYKESQSGK